MKKRLTLNKLISYIETLNSPKTLEKTIAKSIVASESSEIKSEQQKDINTTDIKYIDKFTFKNLDAGIIKPISDLPTQCKKLFDPFIKDINRVGVMTNFINKTNDNVSLYYSLLYCLDDNFINYSLEDQEKYVLALKQKLSAEIYGGKLFEKFGYKHYKWTQKDLREAINEYRNSRIVIRYIADVFGINIFLVNVLEDKIYAIYPEEMFNCYKMNLFLSYYNETFEPLTFNGKRLWHYNDGPFRKLIIINKAHINLMNVDFTNKTKDKQFILGIENLNKYLEIYGINNNINTYTEVPINEYESTK